MYAALCRVALIVVCGFATWRSVRIAAADWLVSEGAEDAFERAIRLAPDNSDLLTRAAISRMESGEASASIDEDLQRAVRLNPADSKPFMTLGIREELRGNNGKAEEYLVHAAEIDHQFKPAWTLANYYFRRNQPEKTWPMVQRILNLEPLGFDPASVFALCWAQTTDSGKIYSGKILGIVPRDGRRSIEYLQFLMATHRAEAAMEAWPIALAAADPADLPGIEILTNFPDFLLKEDRITESVGVWNRLVDGGMIRSGRVDAARGISIADPGFAFPPLAKAFGWRVPDNPGVFASKASDALRFELNGEEPPMLTLLSTMAPVLASTPYRLSAKGDGSSLNTPRDPGFAFQIVQLPGQATTQCPPLLAEEKSAGCDFVTLANTRTVRIDLNYARAQGTTRATGNLQILSARLEFAR